MSDADRPLGGAVHSDSVVARLYGSDRSRTRRVEHQRVDLGMAEHSMRAVRDCMDAMLRAVTHSERDLAYQRGLGELDLAQRMVSGVRDTL